jgi:PKD repeat protein
MHLPSARRFAFHSLGAALFFSLGALGAEDPRREHGFPGLRLSQRFTRGQAIPPALGNRLSEVAKAYDHTEAEFRALCNRDRNSLHADAEARLLYICRALPVLQKAAATASAADVITQPSYPLSDTFFLSSNLNASKTIYLDFPGHTTSGTVWNSSTTNGQPIVTPAYDTDGVPSTFSNTELANIQSIWKRVAEDYAPFNVNVTTKEPPLEELRKTSSTDIFYGIRVVIGGNSNWLGGGAGGVAYLGSFNWSSDTPAFVFPKELGNGNAKYVGEAVSHEAGHAFNLDHDGNSSTEYYEGHANWAPIMGVSYYRAVTQWSKGEYTGANNLEDDTTIIAREVPLRTDVHGNTIATATTLTGPALAAEGIIGTRTDVDYFKVVTGAGIATFTVTPDNVSPNLDVQLRLFNSTGALLATANPTTLNATLTMTLAQGTYYLEVDGLGSGTATTGYNDYGSLGQYRVSGTVPVVNGQPPTAVASSSSTVGTAPFAVSFSSLGSTDPDGLITTYAWNFGDGGTGSGQTISHTYTAPGTYTAKLTVTDNSGLTGTASLTIVVNGTQPPPPVAKVVSVADIGMSLYVNFRKYYAVATITIKDQDGKMVPNATVKGTWSGLVKGSYYGKTNSSGVIRFYSPESRYRGTFTFTVTSVTATGYTYDASKNKETKDSISTP